MVASDIEDDNDMSMLFLLDGFCACCALYFDATFWIMIRRGSDFDFCRTFLGSRCCADLDKLYHCPRNIMMLEVR